jgi:hypothetical protein
LNLIKDLEKITIIRERKGLKIRIIIVILVVILGLLKPFLELPLLKILLIIYINRKGIILIILNTLNIINKLRKT